MPLTRAKRGETRLIRHIEGPGEIRRYLEKRGFVKGGAVTVVNEIDGNLIVSVKARQVAIGRELAGKILV